MHNALLILTNVKKRLAFHKLCFLVMERIYDMTLNSVYKILRCCFRVFLLHTYSMFFNSEITAGFS